MKKTILLICLIMFLVLIADAKNPEATGSNSSAVPQEYLKAINTKSTVTWHLLDALSEDDVLFCGLAEDLASVQDTDVERITSIVESLNDPVSFAVMNVAKESMFLADVAVQFAKDKDTTVVFYSFYCDLIRFYKDGKYFELDGENVRAVILSGAKANFPNDKFLRRIQK